MRLHDVRDLEGLVRSILRERLGNMSARLDEDATASAYSYLLGEAWILGLGYDRKRGVKFSTLLWQFAGLRLVDWYRREFVDHRYYKATPLSLDALIEQEREDLTRRGQNEEWVTPSIAPTLALLQAPDHADAVCEHVDLEAVLRRLRPVHRFILVARATGYSTTECAAALGISPRAARRRDSCAREELERRRPA